MFVDYLLGTAEIKANDASVIFRISGTDIQLSNVKVKEGYVTFTVPLYKVSKIKSLVNETDFEIVKISGFPRLLLTYKRRWGLAVGLLIFFSILLMSTQVIWTFKVSGNENVEDEEIIAILNELDCTYGTQIRKIDFDMLCNDFLIKCPDIAWISVNMNGTHANVEVRETIRGKEEAKGCNNVIASCDAQIVQITAYSGKKQVAIGDVVRKGDLLISAIGSFGEGRNKIEGADGLVLAETSVDFEIVVPYKREKKVYTDNDITQNRLKFFNFYINLFLNSGIPYDKYDKIIGNNQVELGGVIKLPIWNVSEQYKEYYLENTFISTEEAEVLAMAEYRTKLRDIAAECEILNITTSHSAEDDRYVIRCSLYCIRDIAELSPIIVE